MATRDMKLMSNDELMEELGIQSQWSSDDAFESAAFNRGDGGEKRDDYIAELYAESVERGLNHHHCQQCYRADNPTEIVEVQMIPGSFDTKFTEMFMCAECRTEYQDLLRQI